MTNDLRKSATEKKDKKKINILTNNADMKKHVSNFDLKK